MSLYAINFTVCTDEHDASGRAFKRPCDPPSGYAKNDLVPLVVQKRVGNSGGGSTADQRHESDWRWGVHSKTHINSCKFLANWKELFNMSNWCARCMSYLSSVRFGNVDVVTMLK